MAPLNPASLMIGGRLVNLALGLLSVPVLIKYLSGTGFAAWALLLALAAAFSLLDLGLGGAALRHAAGPAQAGNVLAVRAIFSKVWLMLAVSYGVAACLIVPNASEIASWLRLPETPWFSGADSVVFVLTAAAISAVLRTGEVSLLARGDFRAVAAVALLQPLCSNAAAMAVAIAFARVDLALAAYWSAQLAMLAVVFCKARRLCMPAFGRHTVEPDGLRRLIAIGIAGQLASAVQFVSFQFDKLVIASWVGLWAVAPFEVANRAAAALRSLPASAEGLQLPAALARADCPLELWRWYLAASRATAYGVAVFLLAPMAMAPVFLYAWTGEMGHVGHPAFLALAFGAAANVMALPAIVLLQVADKPALQARVALMSLGLNMALSLLLVAHLGSAGAAIGTAVAMSVGALHVTTLAHRQYGQSIVGSLRHLAKLWPLPAVCGSFGLVCAWGFDVWFSTLPPDLRFARSSRVGPGVAALAAYALCVVSMILIESRRGHIGQQERQALLRWWPGRTSRTTVN